MFDFLSQYAAALALVAGYGYAIFVETIVVRNLVDTLYDCVAPHGSSDPEIRPHPWQTQSLTLVEGFLYVSFLQLGLGYLIGLWLLSKVAGQWHRWVMDSDEDSQKPDGRSMFHIFLIGNSFTLIYAITGYKLIHWIAQGRVRGIWVPILVVVATLIFWLWLRQFRKAPELTLKPAAAAAA